MKMDTLTRRDRGFAMEHLTDGMDPVAVDAIKKAESILCIIFNRQSVYSTKLCFNLRKTLVDLVNSISPQAR